MDLNRRRFLSLFAAPAIVPAASLMPVRVPPLVVPTFQWLRVTGIWTGSAAMFEPAIPLFECRLRYAFKTGDTIAWSVNGQPATPTP